MKTFLFIVSATIYCTFAYFDDFTKEYFRTMNISEDKELNLNESYFPQLRNYRVGGKLVQQTDYPWIASVLHSTTKTVPYLCTAVCVEKNIFISAARCVYTLKVVFTSVMYQRQRLMVKALVLPSKPSKQLYDDVGFIVTNGKLNGEWHTVQVYDDERTDDVFSWFRKIKFENDFEHKVIGYAFAKTKEDIPIWHRSIDLVELDVTVDCNLCHKILSYNDLISGFPVPCYHSCTFYMFQNDNATCRKYHGVEGGALINKRTKRLFGIATWGAYYRQYELPVGFTVPNSKSFNEDFKCALKIENNQETVTEGLYQRLCDSKR